MMDCDYNALMKESIELSNMFKEISSSLQSLEDTYKAIVNQFTWNSDTRNYFSNKTKLIMANDDCVNDKFLNIRQFLDQVIDNYSTADSQLGSLYKFKG